MKKVLRKATCECTAVPVCCGSAYRNKGVQKLLDAIVEYMPAPQISLQSREQILRAMRLRDIHQMRSRSQHLHSRSWQTHS